MTRINFTEGELKVDDLLARLELMRATEEEGKEKVVQHEAIEPEGIMKANASFTSGDSALDPWKRTVSQLSMSTILENDVSVIRVELVTFEKVGPFYDRHRTYLVSTTLQNGTVTRRYKDFAWLQNALVHKFPFRVVPPVPLKSLSRESEKFLASRRRGLEEFLFLVVNHPVLQKDALVVEFLSAEDFSSTRSRISPTWQEEFISAHSNQSSEPTPIREPNWTIYDDARQWSQQMRNAIEDLRNAIGTLSDASGHWGRELSIISEKMTKILEITHRSDHTDLSVPRNLDELPTPLDRFVSVIGVDIISNSS